MLSSLARVVGVMVPDMCPNLWRGPLPDSVQLYSPPRVLNTQTKHSFYHQHFFISQEGQEDVRKAPFYGQIAPVWPVSVVFSAASVYQLTGMGVVSVGEGQGTDRVDMGTG